MAGEGLTSLMDSIREHGILQPIGLAPGNHLLFGGRRLEAAKRLGMTVIDATRPRTQTDALSLLKAERDENTCRKDMTPEELVDVGMRVEELEREKGRAAMVEGAERRWHGSARVEQTHEPHDTNKEVANALGITTPTYRRMKTVVRAARDDLRQGPHAPGRPGRDDASVACVLVDLLGVHWVHGRHAT